MVCATSPHHWGNDWPGASTTMQSHGWCLMLAIRLDEAVNPSTLGLVHMAFVCGLGFLWVGGWIQRRSIPSMRVEAAYLLRPSLGSYIATLPLHSFGQGKSQERPRCKAGRKTLGGGAKNVLPSLCHHSYPLGSRHPGKCFIHCILYKPQIHRAC